MDLVMDEILTRLPAKSLMRFKCVSKLWSSHITSRYFSNRFLAVPSRQRSRLYMCLWLTGPKDYVILSLVPATPSSFVVDLIVPHMGGCIAHNFGGFMCYSLPNNQPQIFNPATRQLVTLPAPIITVSGHTYVAYYFGHDPVNDQYKVICSAGGGGYMDEMIRSEHWVFVLKPGGGSWKKVTPTPHRPYPSKGLCIDGVIYYVASTDTDECAIVSFHISSEVFKMIQVVPFAWQLLGRVRLINYGGKLTLLFYTDLVKKGIVKLWVLEDATNNELSRKTLVLQPSQLHLVNDPYLFDIGPTQNGKVFFISESDFISPNHILCYDLQSNDMRKIEINGIPDHLSTKNKGTRCVGLMFMDQSENVMHLET